MGGVSPSGAFGATSPFHGEEFLTQLKRNEAAPAADTASTGKPPGDTLLVSAPLYGRCLLVEANLCADCRWTRTENELPPQCNDPMPMSRPLALFASTTFEVSEPRALGERLVRECRGERLVEKEHFLDRQHVAHEDRARRHPGKSDESSPGARRRPLPALLPGAKRP